MNRHSLHLTDEQIAELLSTYPDQSAGAITQQHLLHCPHCQTELASLRASLSNFRIAATNLAAAETPALSQRRIVVPSRSFRRNAWAASFATAAAMLALSVALVHPNPPVRRDPQVAVATPAATVSDDALLDGIQQDLSASIPPSLEPLSVPASQN
jgi:ferric-dicitrate binding protein FerR (iron transport regulator)